MVAKSIASRRSHRHGAIRPTVRRMLRTVGIDLQDLQSSCALCKLPRPRPDDAIWKERRYERSTFARGRCSCIQRMVSSVRPTTGNIRGSRCWIWRRARSRGYGIFSVQGRAVRAARSSLAIFSRARVPASSHVLHGCDTPLCVNPRHLRVGTHRENMADKVSKGRADTTPRRLR